jgi:uncharacterized GH25 family protein/ketosteroid isomerase-like protein
MRISLRRHILVVAGAATALLIAVGVADAHDFWLVPDAFQVAEGATVTVRGQTSSRFPTSESAVAMSRVADARVIGASDEQRITELSTSGTSLVLRHRPTSAGQRIIAVRLAPTTLRASGPGFKRYMELEGAAALAARYERDGLLPKTDSITRRYAKYAKTLVQVGSGGTRAFARVAQHPVEFVPLSDPAALRAGDTLRVRLLYQGRALEHFHAHAGVSNDVSGGEPTDVSLETDAQGIARVPLGRGGLWNVRTLHIVPAPAGSGVDWDSHFATLVFAVAPGREASEDSAAVVAVVAQYHAALAGGDSATALRLLAPDAVILESGGLETVAEYRAHHLPADIAFAAGVPAQRTVRSVVVRGDMASVASTSVSQGEFRGRAVNSTGAELMVLARTGDGWRITAIHWSSRARRAP